MVSTSEAPIKLQTIVARHLRISATHPLVSPQNSWCHQRSVSKDCWEEGRSPSKPTEVAGDSDGRHLSKLRSDNTPQSVEKPLENTKAHQSTNIFEPRTKFVFQFSCIPASSLLSKTSLPGVDFVIGPTSWKSHWPSLAFMSCLKFKSLKRSGSRFVLRNTIRGHPGRWNQIIGIIWVNGVCFT